MDNIRMMKDNKCKLSIVLALFLCCGMSVADVRYVDGHNWRFSAINSTTARLDGSDDVLAGSVTLPDSIGLYKITALADNAFKEQSQLTEVIVPESIVDIGSWSLAKCTELKTVVFNGKKLCLGDKVFWDSRSLRKVVFKDDVLSIGTEAFRIFNGQYKIDYIYFYGTVPSSDALIKSSMPKFANIVYAPQNCAHSYEPHNGAHSVIEAVGVSAFGGFTAVGNAAGSVNACEVEVRTSIRENDPTILDVIYNVKSCKPKVKVRVLAFENGERSIAKVVRPETFVEGTEVNVGDNITPNVEHTVSWRVSSDWATRLAKVKFEVLASEGDLVPLEFMTIPASGQYGAMKISWNALSDAQLLDALLWLTASKDSALSFSAGVLQANGTEVAQNTGFSNNAQREAAASFVFGKMGYQRMTGAILNYANEETRFGLSPSGSRQYAYKMVP